jgi:8-oxo-dGTP pyrophosphatase MutT (NUDIX family)
MIQEKSAGVVIFRIDKQGINYLLLYKKASGHYRESWDFPKGNLEVNESEEVAAKREAIEETGIKNINLIGNFRESINFFYRKEGQIVHKTITFLLAETNQEGVTVSYEHNDYKWCSCEEALNLLTHKNSREILKKADEFLQEYLKQKRL